MSEVNTVIVELPDGRKHTWKNTYYHVHDDNFLSIRRDRGSTPHLEKWTTISGYSPHHYICVYNESEPPETTEYVPPVIQLPYQMNEAGHPE